MAVSPWVLRAQANALPSKSYDTYAAEDHTEAIPEYPMPREEHDSDIEQFLADQTAERARLAHEDHFGIYGIRVAACPQCMSEAA